jgi:outer membrane immunogenic protein
MMKRIFLSFLLVAAATQLASAQVSPVASERSSTEVALEYNYVHSNAPPAQCDCFSMNGGSFSVAQPFRSGHIAGVFDAAVAHSSGIDGLNLTLYSFTSGVRYRPLLHPRWNPFGQVLVGVAHGSGSLLEGNTPASSDATLNFASVIGGGLDYRLRNRWFLRVVDAEYYLTTFSNGVNDRQNNLRVGTGIAYRFGR